MQPDQPPLLSVDNLQVHFPIRAGVLQRQVGAVKAVDGVSFTLARGETLSLVGESGCGKSTTGLALMGLVKPTGGQVNFDGQEIRSFNRAALKSYRRRMQIVFQDPFSSLNPRQRVRDIIRAPLDIHNVGTKAERTERVAELMQRVGLRPDQADNFAHQFSGGQRQRIGIARALALNPDVIVCDEPVSALDVSVQAQILNLLSDLQRDLGVSYLAVSHDLGVVEYISHRVAVMYLGRIVEIGPTEAIMTAPKHPYTQALLSAVPRPGVTRADRVILKGELPDPANPPAGCAFHTRCPQVMDICHTKRPVLAAPGGTLAGDVACHLYP